MSLKVHTWLGHRPRATFYVNSCSYFNIYIIITYEYYKCSNIYIILIFKYLYRYLPYIYIN